MNNPHFLKTLEFLKEIGIEIYYNTIDTPTFLPGIKIELGTLVIDEQKLLYPGDIVHEAGHIAVVPVEERNTLNEDTIGQRKDQAAEEMMVIAWSYALCLHLHIPLDFVFHEHGYKGDAQNIIDNFTKGRYFGVPMLQYTGMCTPNGASDAYPIMKKWTR